jgi:NDP-sugar pyrophosphorylase family protein
MRIAVSREEVLLDTGGGLKRAAWFFLEDSARVDEPFFLHNVDVLSGIDLAAMLNVHREGNALATLAVQSRASSRLLLFDPTLQLRGRAGAERSDRSSESGFRSTGEDECSALAFCGVHVISPRLLPLLTEEGVFPIVRAYLRLSSQQRRIQGFRADQYYWRDVGRPADLAQASLDLHTGIPQA